MLRSIMAVLCVCILTQVILMLLLCPGALDACSAGLYATTPGRLEALSGSCVQIPCNFAPNPPSSNSVFGVWIIKDHNFGPHPENIIFNSSLPNNTYPMNITGDLRKKDCTTLFSNLTTAYSDSYYFRIENKPYLATAACNRLQITVKDSPCSPILEVSGEQTETEVVTITCSAVTPCPHAPPQLTWDLHQGTAHITENNITETKPNGTIITKTKLSITLTDSDDGKMIKCSAAYPVNGGVSKMSDSNIILSVTYGPKNTSVQVSPSRTLSTGQSVTLSCSSRAKPPVQNFTWFRHSSQGPVSVSEGDTYNFNLTEDGDFYCVASNGVRNHSSLDINLRTKIPPAALPWEVILGAGIGLLIVLCLAVFVWYFRSKRQASGQTQREPLEEDEGIHYGEIDFSKFSPKVSPGAEEEETVYAQVQVPKPENTEPTEDMSELYAQVNKK